MVDIPDRNGDAIVRRFGDQGVRFLAEIDDRIADLANRWHLRIGQQYPVGIRGVVVRADAADAGPVVLKLSPVGEGASDDAKRMEWRMLQRLDGERGGTNITRTPSICPGLAPRPAPQTGTPYCYGQTVTPEQHPVSPEQRLAALEAHLADLSALIVEARARPGLGLSDAEKRRLAAQAQRTGDAARYFVGP